MSEHRTFVSRSAVAAIVLLMGVLVSCGGSSADEAATGSETTVAESSESTTAAPTTEVAVARPTILLVHGAFAGPSSWDPVATLLRDDGFEVVVPTNPLRGPTVDTAAIRAALDGIDGDVVVVAHSYGGVPVTNAATGDPDVKGLVYVAAYVPDEGETLGQIQERIPGQLTPDKLVIGPYTGADGASGVGATIAPTAFADVFAADLPADRATTLAGAQSPLDINALNEASGPPAWRGIPSWYLVAAADRIIPPDLARSMATTAGSNIEEADASHAVLLSKPDVVAELIERAAGTTGG